MPRVLRRLLMLPVTRHAGLGYEDRAYCPLTIILFVPPPPSNFFAKSHCLGPSACTHMREFGGRYPGIIGSLTMQITDSSFSTCEEKPRRPFSHGRQEGTKQSEAVCPDFARKAGADGAGNADTNTSKLHATVPTATKQTTWRRTASRNNLSQRPIVSRPVPSTTTTMITVTSLPAWLTRSLKSMPPRGLNATCKGNEKSMDCATRKLNNARSCSSCYASSRADMSCSRTMSGSNKLRKGATNCYEGSPWKGDEGIQERLRRANVRLAERILVPRSRPNFKGEIKFLI